MVYFSAPRFPRVETFVSQPLTRETLEKRLSFPLWSLLRIRHPQQQSRDHPVEFGCRRFVHGLIQVIAGLVIAIANPVVENLVFWCTELVAELESEGRNTVT